MKLDVSEAGPLRDKLKAAFQPLVSMLRIPRNDKLVKVSYRKGRFPLDHPAIGGTTCAPNPRLVKVELIDWNREETNPILKVFCHEFVHVAQVCRGALGHGPNGTSIWYGSTVQMVEGGSRGYRELPWEQEAFALQDMLYDTIKHL